MSRTTSIVSADALFKRMYGKAGTSVVNAKTPLASILMKNKRVDFVGNNFVQPVRFGSAVGLGYRSVGQNLPESVSAPRNSAIFPAKRAYGTAEYDREAIVASRNEEGAFAKVTVDEAAAVMEGFMLHNVERALFGDSTGVLGQISDASITGAGTVASPWAFDLGVTSTYPTKKKYFPRGAKIDLYTVAGVYGMTLEIVSSTVNSSTNVVSLTATTYATGSAVLPVDLDLLYWQGNRNQEIVGLRSIAPLSAGTLYGISQTTNPEFRGLLKSISGALQYDDVNEGIEELSDECGEAPNLAVGSHKTLANLKNLSEEFKRYNVAEVKSSDGKIGFKGIEAMSGDGPFPVIASQMCPEGELWLLNTKYMQMVLRQDFGWFDDDGTILMRDQNKDVYNARYGGYFELFCSKPNTVQRIYGFTS